MSFMSKISSFASQAQGGHAPLPPAPFALGVFGAYCVHQQEQTFKLTENRMSFTGDDFKIKDVNGTVVFRCEATMMSLHDRKRFFDASGRHLFTVLKRRMHIHATYDGVDPQNDEKQLFRVKNQFSIGAGAKMQITFMNLANPHENPEEVFELRGNWFGRKAEIVWKGQPVARISKHAFNVRDQFFDKDTYYLSVAPGVDVAMLVAACIVLDEVKNDQQK